MKYILCLLLMVASIFSVRAQDKSIQETARSYMRQGDFDNSILILTRALQQDANNLELQKDLVLSYFYKRDFTKALDGAKQLIDRDDADVISFQLAGNVYKALEQSKEAEKMYKKALKKFPKSGALHSEYGELLWAVKDYSAIQLWEKGIQEDPSYAGNYYNASLFYYYSKDKIWSLLYGEIFVNMESLTERATNMKQLLLDGYKEKLFTETDLMKGEEKNKSDFAKAVLQTFNKQGNLVNKGITTDALTMVRTRFILDWFNSTNGTKYPFRLFEYHQQLIKEGMFEAYNQWLFGTVENLAAYENWTKTHAEAYTKFATFQKGRILKSLPASITNGYKK